MRTLPLAVLLGLFACGGTATATSPDSAALARAETGAPAPTFTLTDLEGRTVDLASLRGKTVVIEWFNPECPYVVYAHGEQGPLATLPKKWTEQGVVWLAINSNAPGTQGASLEVNKQFAESWGLPSSVLVDTDGAVGRQYGAKTTPQMVVIDKAGTLVYNGALDNAPLGKVAGDALQPWVDEVLTDLANGVPPRRSVTKPYGCSVKYGS